MARFVKSAQTQPMKYMFEMTLHEISLRVPYEMQVIVVLKRGSRRLETQNFVTIKEGQPIANYKDEKLTMMTTVYKEKGNNKKIEDRIVSASPTRPYTYLVSYLTKFFFLNRAT